MMIAFYILSLVAAFFFGAEFECYLWRRELKRKHDEQKKIFYKANIKNGNLIWEYTFKEKSRYKEQVIDNGVDKGWFDIVELEEIDEEKYR